MNQEHYFYYDKWLQENFAPDYRSRRDAFPCIELSDIDHKKAHLAARDWFEQNTQYGRRGPIGHQWKSITAEQMENSATHMTLTIGIPESKINKLKNLSSGYIKKVFKVGGCNE